MEEPPKCKGCGQLLSRMIWNTKGDILVCGNMACQMFHQPQGFVEEPRYDILEVTALCNKKRREMLK